MVKYKVRVYATMEFEVEAPYDSLANHEATEYVKDHVEDFDWNFDSIKNTETNKEV